MTMAEFVIKDVCKICFNASSQKANPTLTLEEKAVYESGRKICPNCRQNWTGQKVTKDAELNRWVLIRPRPLKMNPHIDYQLCTSVLKKQPCPKGHGLCTFAHSRAELHCWNKDRYREPRPVQSGVIPSQISLCKHIVEDGACPYGQRCVYAHSEEERERWIEELLGGGKGSGYGGTQSGGYICEACNIHCTSQQQFEEHLSGQKHRQIVAAASTSTFPPHPMHPTFYSPPFQFHDVAPRLNHVHGIRQMPDRLPANGFKMCVGLASPRGCFYGSRCTFAHSEAELEAWNKQAMRYRGQRIAAGSIQSHMTPHSWSHGDLDEFETESPTITPDQGDFAQRIRTTVMLDYQAKEAGKDLCGFEKTLQNVTINEISGHDEALTISDNAGSVSWLFEVATTAPRTLQSIVLFDMLAPEYSIDSVDLVMYGGHTKPINFQATPPKGSGVFIGQRITPPDKVNVKILFKPRSGVLGQMVIFDFGNFYMARYLCVHVINEQDKRLLTSSTSKRVNNRPEKPDYFWEQTYASHVVEMGGLDSEETGDEKLPEHQLPKLIQDLIEKGKYDNMQRKVVQKTYVRRMHNLLYLEEFQERKDLSRYDLYDIQIIPEDYYQTVGELINDPRYSFATIEMDEVLFEGGRSIRPGDHIMMLLKPSATGQSELHKCLIHNVLRESVVLKMSKRTAEMCSLSGNKASIRFQPSRVSMRAMHEGLDRVDTNVIFPDMNQETTFQMPTPSVKQCLSDLDQSRLNEEQKNAIRSVLDPSCKTIPTLVLGPFGCGKTETLSECAKLLSLNDPTAKILICTHNNSAADIYVKSLHKEFNDKRNKKAPLIRLYYSERNPRTVDPDVRQYCKMRNDKFYHVASSELTPYTVVVTTTITARMLWLNGVERGYFTHILIDEAAQVLEAELLIVLCLAGKDTKIALAGDAMQMDPPVYSSYAKKYGLDVSLLERLYTDELYNSELGKRCKIQLSENHRSHYDILHLPSKLFYENKLICKAVFPDNGPKNIPNLQFVGVDGHEAQEEHSPSYYNDQEVVKIAEEINYFCNGNHGLQPQQICVLSYYELQVKRIRSYLRKRRLSDVEVLRIDGIQGKEYRALIISTVRTCASVQDTESENEDGFLNNVKFFNTAITRAKEWLVIVGEPITLCTVGYNTACWMELIENCIQKKTFRYQCADMFMKYLETRVISRQIMQKNHGEFLKKSTAPPHASKIIAPPVSTEASSEIRLVQQSPSMTVTQQQHLLIKETILKSMQSRDETLATTIYGEVLKLSPSHLNVFLTQPQAAIKYVRELEDAMKRGGLTSVLMNNARLQPPNVHENTIQKTPVASNVSNIMGDLPPFLQNQVESLTQHLRFCDTQKCTSQASFLNLAEQKKILLQQMSLVNHQILKYREFIKINAATVAVASQQTQLHLPNMMNSLIQPMSQLSTGQQLPPVGTQQLMYGGGLAGVPSHAMGVAAAISQQPRFRPDNFSSSFQNTIPFLQQQTHSSSTIPPGRITQPQVPHMSQYVGPGGYANHMNVMSQQPTLPQQPTAAAFVSMHSNSQQISSGMKSNYQDPFVQSQPSFGQTTQLISPLNNLTANQTWNGDEDLD